MASLTALSDKKWRKLGYYAEPTESILRLPGGVTRRKDLLGFVDRLYLREDGLLVLVQTTSGSNVAARVKKILHGETGKGQYRIRIAELARRMLRAGARIVVEGWTLDEKKWRYRDREMEITLEMVDEALRLPD